MEIKDRPISELIPAEYNPRRLTEKQFKDLKKSLQRLEVLEPAVINTYKGRENVIISGHQRIKVAQDLGMTHFPCFHVAFPPEKEKEANIRLNKNTGEFDFDILANEFDLDDLFDYGFDEKELLSIGPDTEEKPEKEDKPEKLCPHCGGSLG